MTHKTTTLDNGLRIVTCEMKEALSVTASIMIGTGGRYEDYNVNGGVSHILEHMLFKGTAKRPTAQIIAEEIDSVGGYNNAYTSNDVTNYYVKVPKEHSALAIEIMADMMTGSLIEPEELDRERNIIIQEMKMRLEDDPAGMASVLVPGLIWPGSSMANEVIGPAEVINTIKRDAVAAYWKAHYQPKNMVVAVAGGINHEAVVDQVQTLLGQMTGGEPQAIVPVDGPLAKEFVATKEKDVSQAQIFITARAYPYRHPDDAAAKVMARILGRGMSSRLFESVRARKGLAYTVDASLQNYVDTGIFDVYAGVDPTHLEAALEAIMDELKLIAREKVTPAELAKAKNQTRGGLVMGLENNAAVAERIGLQTLLLGSIESVEDQLARFDAVTAEDVLRVAADLLDPAKLRLAVVTPNASNVESAFKKLIGEK